MRTLASLRAMREPPQQASDLMAHVLTAEHIWLRRITGGTPAYDVFQSLGLEECERLAAANHAGFAHVLATDNRDRVVAYRTTSGLAHDDAARGHSGACVAPRHVPSRTGGPAGARIGRDTGGHGLHRLRTRRAGRDD